MKRELIAIMAVLVAASLALAAPKVITISMSLGTNTTATATSESVVGYIEEIEVLCTDGVSTGSCSVTAQSPDSTVAAYTLATNSVVDEKRFYPTRDNTDTAGSALTNDPPARFFLIGDTVTFAVAGSPTNKTWRARIKTSDR